MGVRVPGFRHPCRMTSAHGGATGENAVKTIVSVLGLASLIALAARDSEQENKVENAHESQADAIDNQADNMEAMAETGRAHVCTPVPNAQPVSRLTPVQKSIHTLTYHYASHQK